MLISVSGQGPDDLISTTSGEVPPLGVGLYIGIVWMPLVMKSVSYVTVDIGTVMYQLGKSVKRCSRRLSASSLCLNSNVGLTHRLRSVFFDVIRTRVIAATRSQTMNPNPDVVVFYMQICPMGQPQEAESPRRCGDEFIRALARDRNQHNVWGRG